MRRRHILKIHNALPAAFDAEGIPVVLDKAIHEIHMRRGVVHPGHAVIVENREVARFIKADQLPYAFLLLRRFRHALRLAQPVDYLLNGW